MHDEIFVFGSNLAGRHGAGAARTAHALYGARYGVGVGRTGRAYAIPTKDEFLRSLSWDVIHGHVREFLRYARKHRELSFRVARIGCGLAGYHDADIAPMFRRAPMNCHLPIGWRGWPQSL